MANVKSHFVNKTKSYEQNIFNRRFVCGNFVIL